MKRILLLLLASALAVSAQNPQEPPAQEGIQAPGQMKQITNLVEKEPAPTYSDMNCSGYITKQTVNAQNYIVGGEESPNSDQFGQFDLVFLNGGGYQEGQRYTIVRQVKDPNQMEMFPGQHAAVAATGNVYFEMGHVRVIGLRGSVAIAVVEFSCNALTVGDYVIPLMEHPQVNYKPASAFNQWPTDAASVTGRIIMARDFDTIAATGHKVYLNVGADKGVKPGDYFRIVRNYDPQMMDEIEAFSYMQPMGEESQVNHIAVTASKYKEFPKQAIGEMVVLTVTPTSSTAMITLALRGVNVGDHVELEGSSAPPPQSGGQR